MKDWNNDLSAVILHVGNFLSYIVYLMGVA